MILQCCQTSEMCRSINVTCGATTAGGHHYRAVGVDDDSNNNYK